VEAHFDEFSVKAPSPQIIELLAGSYTPTGNYTNKVVPEAVALLGKDDGLHAFDAIYTGIKHAFSAEWFCDAEESIDAKAKEARRAMRKAVSQFEKGSPGVIHVGYETLSGARVEFERHGKIAKAIHDLDCGDKNVSAVFFNAFQCVCSEGNQLETAETTLSFGLSDDLLPETILSEQLLLYRDETVVSEDTHWRQDFERDLCK
jgi:hypothetical protein